MKKIFIFVLLLSSFLNADIVTNVSMLGTKNKCVYNDYYLKGGSFYYRYATSPNTWRSTTTKKYPNFLINGYVFDTNISQCYPNTWRVMGMSIEDFNFLNAFIGLLFGLFMLISVSYLFMTVGGKK